MRIASPSLRTWERIVVGLWMLACLGGLAVLARYKGRPGPTAVSFPRWPEGSVLPRDPRLPTLVLLAHPRCPCTRATLTELRELLGPLRGRVTVHVLFLLPTGSPAAWTHTASWQEAASIPGLTVAADPGGIEATRFGARTSGQVLVYSANGTLRFSGGLTGARGHLGSNRGLDLVTSLLRTGACQAGSAPVYGCPLEDPREPR